MTYEEATSRCWLEVDLDAIASNYRSAVEIVGENSSVIPVLKANAYGMNAVVVAERLMREGAKLFAVASSDEAEQIIATLPGIRVLPMGLVGESAMRRLIARNMPLTLYSQQQGRKIAEIAAGLGIAAQVHVKSDTGLHRLGLSPENAADIIAELCGGGGIVPVALYTHLAIHTPEMDFAQIDQLLSVQQKLDVRGIHVSFLHAVDSIGMVRYPGRQLSAARTGAWLYGVRPRNCPEPEHCRNVARFRARISQVRSLPCGELVGYDDDAPLTRDSVIATVSAGYIDGAPRCFTDWKVEVRGMLAPAVGLACMDQLMIDVTNIPGVSEGDVVTFVGGMIDIDEYSRMGGFNRNEAWARIGRRVPRVFYENGQVVQISTEL